MLFFIQLKMLSLSQNESEWHHNSIQRCNISSPPNRLQNLSFIKNWNKLFDHFPAYVAIYFHPTKNTGSGSWRLVVAKDQLESM